MKANECAWSLSRTLHGFVRFATEIPLSAGTTTANCDSNWRTEQGKWFRTSLSLIYYDLCQVSQSNLRLFPARRTFFLFSSSRIFVLIWIVCCCCCCQSVASHVHMKHGKFPFDSNFHANQIVLRRFVVDATKLFRDQSNMKMTNLWRKCAI